MHLTLPIALPSWLTRSIKTANLQALEGEQRTWYLRRRLIGRFVICIHIEYQRPGKTLILKA